VGSIDKIIYIANHNLVSGTVDEIINSEQLSKLYGSEIEVIKDSKGRLVIVGARQAAHHV